MFRTIRLFLAKMDKDDEGTEVIGLIGYRDKKLSVSALKNLEKREGGVATREIIDIGLKHKEHAPAVFSVLEKRGGDIATKGFVKIALQHEEHAQAAAEFLAKREGEADTKGLIKIASNYKELKPRVVEILKGRKDREATRGLVVIAIEDEDLRPAIIDILKERGDDVSTEGLVDIALRDKDSARVQGVLRFLSKQEGDRATRGIGRIGRNHKELRPAALELLAQREGREASGQIFSTGDEDEESVPVVLEILKERKGGENAEYIARIVHNYKEHMETAGKALLYRLEQGLDSEQVVSNAFTQYMATPSSLKLVLDHGDGMEAEAYQASLEGKESVESTASRADKRLNGLALALAQKVSKYDALKKTLSEHKTVEQDDGLRNLFVRAERSRRLPGHFLTENLLTEAFSEVHGEVNTPERRTAMLSHRASVDEPSAVAP